MNSRISVIVATYNGGAQLDAALNALLGQSDQNLELIVADDGSSESITREVIQKHSNGSATRIVHARQDDDGFRLARSRNNAVQYATGDIFLFLDHDILVPPRFLKILRKAMLPGWFVAGRRVMLDEPYTASVLSGRRKYQEIFGLNLVCYAYKRNLIGKRYLLPMRNRVPGTQPHDFRGMAGFCIGLYREDFMKIDGFEGAIDSYGAEDWEFMARLINAGVQGSYLPRQATVAHLWHSESPVRLDAQGYKVLQDSIAKKRVRALDGYSCLSADSS